MQYIFQLLGVYRNVTYYICNDKAHLETAGWQSRKLFFQSLLKEICTGF